MGKFDSKNLVVLEFGERLVEQNIALTRYGARITIHIERSGAETSRFVDRNGARIEFRVDIGQ